jgi:hypothetical protein
MMARKVVLAVVAEMGLEVTMLVGAEGVVEVVAPTPALPSLLVAARLLGRRRLR